MRCSDFLIMVASLLTMIAFAVLIVAFCTDNWHYVMVDNKATYPNTTQSVKTSTFSSTTVPNEKLKYKHIKPKLVMEEEEEEEKEEDDDTLELDKLLHSFPVKSLVYNNHSNQSAVYSLSKLYSRTIGLFRICFVDNKPPGFVGDCIDIDLSSIDSHNTTNDYAHKAFQKLHARRGVVALLAVALLLMVITLIGVCVTGFKGRIPPVIAALGICLFIGFLAIAGAIATCTFMEIYEYSQWDREVEERSQVLYDWSYWMAICSGCLALIASILFFVAACCLHAEMPREEIFTSELFYFN